jgi:hypothetical protein
MKCVNFGHVEFPVGVDVYVLVDDAGHETFRREDEGAASALAQELGCVSSATILN